MIERHELYDPDLLLDYLLRVNNMLSQREMNMWELLVGREESNYVRREEKKSETIVSRTRFFADPILCRQGRQAGRRLERFSPAVLVGGRREFLGRPIW